MYRFVFKSVRNREEAEDLNRRSISRYAAGKLGVLLLKLGAWLKQFEQSPNVYEDHV